MQAVCSTSFKGVAVPRTVSAPRAARPAAARVVCRANPVQKAAAAVAGLPALLAAHPALALVDDRLAGEGTGKVLGVSGAEGWAIVGAFSFIWILYYISQKDLGGDKGEDSGMSL